MKTKIINNVESKEINWDKINLVRSDLTGAVVLTNGHHDRTGFSGTVIIPGNSGDFIGRYSEIWNKKTFIHITQPTTIEFNPE